MEDQQGDYEYYTQRADNTTKYVLIAIVVVAIAGIIIWMVSRNRDLSAENQRLQASGDGRSNYDQNAAALMLPNPQEDLKVTFDVHSNLVAVPIIKGSVYNASARTTYKNVALSVSYYTDGDELIGRENIVAAYTLHPGQIAEVRHKPEIKAYRRAQLFRIQLLEATPQ